jgi:hypothetical protein
MMTTIISGKFPMSSVFNQKNKDWVEAIGFADFRFHEANKNQIINTLNRTTAGYGHDNNS